MNFSIKVAALAIGFLSFCKSADIETGLEDAKDAINKLAKLGHVEGYLDVLTSLNDWGTYSIMSTAMTINILTANDVDWQEDEVSLMMWNKYVDFKAALKNLHEEISLDTLPENWTEAENQLKIFDGKIEEIVTKGSDAEKKVFIEMYEAKHNGITEEIYRFMTSESDNIFESTKHNLKNDKRGTFEIVIKTTMMLLHSLSIDTVYKLFKSESDEQLDATLEEISSNWKPKFTDLGTIISQLNDELTKAWEQQYQSDVETYLRNIKQSNTNTMAKTLHKLLQDKFYWRNWFVVVTDNTMTNDDIEINICNGLSYMNMDGKHIFVTSLDDNIVFNSALATALSNQAKSSVRIFFTKRRAREINKQISASCKDFAMFGTFSKTASGTIIGRNQEFETSTVRFWIFERTKFRSFIMG